MDGIQGDFPADECVIDKDKRLSQSLLWELQNSAYIGFGVDAWVDKGVPFYLTSNPFTARQYAQVALGYLRDCVRKSEIDYTQPLYIFDLGAGTGRFGFLFLKYLLSVMHRNPFHKIHICYVMTDMVESNIAFWQSHPYLQELIRCGHLDFAYYRADYVRESLELRISGHTLQPGSLINPAIVIGNYFFDTIPQDLFKVQKGELYEGRVTISTLGPVVREAPDPTIIQNMRCSYSYEQIADRKDYYPGRAGLNAILEHYADTFEGISFLFPIGAFDSLDYFSRLSKQRYLLLAGDQGVCTEDQIRQWGEPAIARHGSFSIAVSYHAIAHYFRDQGGTGVLTTLPDPLFVVMAAALKGGVEQYPELLSAFNQTFDAFEPSDYWKLVSCTEAEWKTPSLEFLLMLLKLGHWDPMNFHAFFPAIHAQLPQASDKLRTQLCRTIDFVWEQFYPVSKSEADFVINLGVLLHEMKHFDKALTYFKRALHLAGDREDIWKNIAACYLSLQDIEAALASFQKAKEAETKTESE